MRDIFSAAMEASLIRIVASIIRIIVLWLIALVIIGYFAFVFGDMMFTILKGASVLNTTWKIYGTWAICMVGYFTVTNAIASILDGFLTLLIGKED